MNFPKPSLTALLVCATLSLVACGGEGDESADYDVNANTNADGSLTGGNTGKTTAAFVPGTNARSVVAGLGNLVGDPLPSDNTQVVQAADGAVTTLGSVSLKDVVTVNEISGDATFAMGRWSKGRVSSSSINMLLDGTDARSYHYLAYNVLPATTAPKPLTCDAGTFTAPSLWNSGTVPAGTKVGTTTGSATLTWVPATATAATSANINLTFTTQANGSSLPSSYDINVSSTSYGGFSAVGRYLAQGPGVAITMGDAGNGAVMIGALYRVLLPNNLTYEGIMKFRCA